MPHKLLQRLRLRQQLIIRIIIANSASLFRVPKTKTTRQIRLTSIHTRIHFRIQLCLHTSTKLILTTTAIPSVPLASPPQTLHTSTVFTEAKLSLHLITPKSKLTLVIRLSVIHFTPKSCRVSSSHHHHQRCQPSCTAYGITASAIPIFPPPRYPKAEFTSSSSHGTHASAARISHFSACPLPHTCWPAHLDTPPTHPSRLTSSLHPFPPTF